MRVALLSHNAEAEDAIGNQVAEKLAFFRERSAEVRVFVEVESRLHPEVAACSQLLAPEPRGPEWDYIATADLVVVELGQYYRLLNLLPLLAGGRPRILIDYHGVTPAHLWTGHNREAIEKGRDYRGLVWCADAAIAHSRFTARELTESCHFPARAVHQLALPVHHAFSPGEPERNWRRDLRLNDASILLYVGRLALSKGLRTLVDALPLLQDGERPVHAVLVGKTHDLYQDETRACLERARSLGVADRLHVVGPLPGSELRDMYRTADVFVTPSQSEGFGIPVIEAMSSGMPVIAARAAALPETVGHAGLTFTPGDAGDLARQVKRVLTPLGEACFQGAEPGTMKTSPTSGRRIAVVAFRFGGDFPGGAETSLRTIARTLRGAGHSVEVFTTCTDSEAVWSNVLPQGTVAIEGVPVHRFLIDSHDRTRHLEAVRAVWQADGPLPAEVEQAYLKHSIHSTGLVEALRRRMGEFDALIVGPYLFGLTWDVARAFPEKTLLLPCFHDEPALRLAAWMEAYERVGGILFHSAEEAELALLQLGLNHPRATCLGTLIDVTTRGNAEAGRRRAGTDRYVVYCGRYSSQKRLPMLLDWARRFQEDQSDSLRFVFMGEGEVDVPRAWWARDLGFVSEKDKRDVLAGASALIQLSQYESLSLVALEAWAQGTPVIADQACAVLSGHVLRSGGGRAVVDHADFVHALNDLATSPGKWKEMGRRGQEYVRREYANPDAFLGRLEQAVTELAAPPGEAMRRRGLERATLFSRERWREKFAQIVEGLLEQEPRPYRFQVEVESYSNNVTAAPGTRRLLVPVRVHNRGSHAALGEGPGRTVLGSCLVHPDGTKHAPEETSLSGLLMPGATQAAAVSLALPREPGEYDALIWAKRVDHPQDVPNAVRIVVRVGDGGADREQPACAPLLDAARSALAEAHERQQLPDDYSDVTEGWFAALKKGIKRKLLGNFKHAYVDVLSRQQTQVNRQLILAVQQLSECCETLDHAVRAVQERVARLEEQLLRQAKNQASISETTEPCTSGTGRPTRSVSVVSGSMPSK